MSTQYTLNAHSLHTQRTLIAHSMHIHCTIIHSLYIHCTFTAYSLHIHCTTNEQPVNTQCTLSTHSIHTQYTLNTYSAHTQRTLNTHSAHILCSSTDSGAWISYLPVAGLNGSVPLPEGSPVTLIGMGRTQQGGSGTLKQVQVATGGITLVRHLNCCRRGGTRYLQPFLTPCYSCEACWWH